MKSTTNQRKEHVGYNSIIIFIRLAVVASQNYEILRKFELVAVQGHPRSLILVSIESAYTTSYHRLRGSASPVLTATHHSYGSPKLSDFFPAHPWRSDPQPILTQNGSYDVHSRKDVPFAVKIDTFHTP